MSDILIRNVPDEVVAAIDLNARQAGLSRNEYLRRTLARESQATRTTVSIEDLTAFSNRFADLGNPSVMDKAWQ